MNRLNRTAIVIFFTLAFFSTASPAIAAYGLEVGKTPPDFTAFDLQGKRYALYELKGRIVILHFFATWEPFSQKVVKHLKKFSAKYEKKGLIILAIGMQSGIDGVEKLKDFRTQENINYAIVPDENAAITKKYGISALPVTFILDTEGVIQFYKIGSEEKDVKDMEKTVKKLLKNVKLPKKK